METKVRPDKINRLKIQLQPKLNQSSRPPNSPKRWGKTTTPTPRKIFHPLIIQNGSSPAISRSLIPRALILLRGAGLFYYKRRARRGSFHSFCLWCATWLMWFFFSLSECGRGKGRPNPISLRAWINFFLIGAPFFFLLRSRVAKIDVGINIYAPEMRFFPLLTEARASSAVWPTVRNEALSSLTQKKKREKIMKVSTWCVD